MYLYLATSNDYSSRHIVKLGMTENPQGRLVTYLTGCPPHNDIYFDTIWKTNATNRDELYHYEEILHNRFIRYRMMRYLPGDSEWFDFCGNDALMMVKDFMNTMPWVIETVVLTEIKPKVSLFHRHIPTNTKFIKNKTARSIILDKVQESVINAIIAFLLNPLLYAATVIAPCGFGKTVVTCKGIDSVTTAIICCPSTVIQSQWIDTLVSLNVFTRDEILIVGSSKHGTTDKATIHNFINDNLKYCIVTTYMSSNLLVDLITNEIDIIVLDEAHHLGGVVAENEGEGKTRRLMMKAVELKIKRLSLTFTPRYVIARDDCNLTYSSMDDENIFGKQIVKIQLRDLIESGVLPDYRVWCIRDAAKKADGILGKASCILDAWEARHVVRGTECYILHHLIVFAATNEEAKMLETYFKEKTKETIVLRVQGGDSLEQPLREFTNAKRAIIVNCKVLGEGVDIRIANAVAITYTKYSRAEIGQMTLRPGRWDENKSKFHIILPIIDSDDMTGYENTLTALASYDKQLYDEIMLRVIETTEKDIVKDIRECDYGEEPDNIIIDEYDGTNMDEIRTCFINIRNNLFPAFTYSQAKKLIATHKITCKADYYELCKKDVRLPREPDVFFKSSFVNWIDYLSIERKYYELEECKKKVGEYLELYQEIKMDMLNLFKVCCELCKIDALFPPKDVWTEYYEVSDLQKIFIRKTKKKIGGAI